MPSHELSPTGPTEAIGNTVSRQEKIHRILGMPGVVLTDSHFVFTGGRHSDSYFNKDAIYPHPDATRELCGMWAEDFQDNDIDVVVGPEKGGIILSHVTAQELTHKSGREVTGVYAEKTGNNGFVFTRGYGELVRARRVLVVEDVLTTGGSVKKVVDLVRKTGGEVVGLGAITNRGGVKPEDVGVDRIDALITLHLNSWPEHECELCKRGVPVNTHIGKGKEFLLKG